MSLYAPEVSPVVLPVQSMRDNWIDNYAGEWVDDTGRVLRIVVSDDNTAAVSLLVNGEPLKRPWCNNAPSVDMQAKYDPSWGPGLEVALGREGFMLGLDYEPAYELLPDQPEALTVDVSWEWGDHVAESHASFFMPLGPYVRKDAEQGRSRRPSA